MRQHEIEDIENILLEKYKTAIDFAIEKFKKGIAIYRGSRSSKMYSNEKIIYSNPTLRVTDRKSSNTYNYYSLWMDNNPQWSSFPKRSKSLICSTDILTADSYGKPKIVVPLINCTIGICPEHDLWYSFAKVNSLLKLSTWLYDHFTIQWRNQDNENLTYPELIQKLKDTRPDFTMDHWYKDLEDLLKKYGNAEDVLDIILNPSENNFMLTTWSQFNKRPDENEDGFEVWLSAPCLLIDPYYFTNLALSRNTNATL